jgi:hypothetical protein
MKIGPVGFLGYQGYRFSPRIPAQQPLPVSSFQATDLARNLLDLRKHVDGLRGASESHTVSGRARRGVNRPARATSADNLTVTTAGSPTPLQTFGLKSAPTSLSGVVKDFTGSSTSQATLNGTYDGSLGEQVGLTFVVIGGGSLGSQDVRVDVFDDQGTRTDRIDIDEEGSADVFTLSMGLDVQFSPGVLNNNDTFALELSTSGGVIDADQVFQGSGLPGSGTYQANFDGNSTAVATVGGAFEGAFDDDLRFRVLKAGVVGQDDIEIQVLDSAGLNLGTLEFDRDLAPGTALTLSNGLSVSLSDGTFEVNDGAEIDAQALYTDLATTGGATPILAELGGTTLTPGTYSFSSTANIAAGTTLTLSGAGEYIFQVGSAITANVLSSVLLQDGASPDQVFWQVTSAATLNGHNFEGTVVAQAAITLGVGAELNGIALATAGPVTMAGDNTVGLPVTSQVSVNADDKVVFRRGLEVNPGTLFINDTEIDVHQLDTIRTLADKITASGAGVTASFDVSTGEFSLTSNEDGSGAIRLGSDDTGFFAAIGLEEGDQQPGTNAGTVGVTDLSQLEGLQSGTFSINGEEVSIDVQNDTIDDVLLRINALEANIEATFVDNRLQLHSSEAFELRNETSGFFGSVSIETGVYKPEKSTNRTQVGGFEKAVELKQSLFGLRRSLNTLFAMKSDSRLPDFAGLLRESILSNFRDGDADANDDYVNTGLGLRFHFQATTDVFSIESDILNRAISGRSNELWEFLSGRPEDEDRVGLVESLSGAIDKLLDKLVLQHDPTGNGGLLLDIMA